MTLGLKPVSAVGFRRDLGFWVLLTFWVEEGDLRRFEQ